MKARKVVIAIALVILLAAGFYASFYASLNIPVTYDAKGQDMVELYENPSDYDPENPDGIADLIVKTNLERTNAANAVASVVFDYRGYDTIGESFILLAAISGSFVILRINKSKKEEDIDE